MNSIAFVHILRKRGLDYKKIILANSLFFSSKNVEYLVYDNTESFEIINFIRDFKKVKYMRVEFMDMRTSKWHAKLLVEADNVFFIQNEEMVNTENFMKYLENKKTPLEKLKNFFKNLIEKDLLN